MKNLERVKIGHSEYQIACDEYTECPKGPVEHRLVGRCGYTDDRCHYKMLGKYNYYALDPGGLTFSYYRIIYCTPRRKP